MAGKEEETKTSNEVEKWKENVVKDDKSMEVFLFAAGRLGKHRAFTHAKMRVDLGSDFIRNNKTFCSASLIYDGASSNSALRRGVKASIQITENPSAEKIRKFSNRLDHCIMA